MSFVPADPSGARAEVIREREKELEHLADTYAKQHPEDVAVNHKPALARLLAKAGAVLRRR